MPEKTLSSERIYEGRIVNLRIDQTEVKGKPALREVVEHPGGVAILAFDENERVFCVKQYRYAQQRMMLELPAGKLERKEDPLETGKRELQEETGYQAEHWLFLGELIPTGAYLEEKIWMYAASGLSYVGQHLDEDEELELMRFSLEELTTMILDQTIIDAKTIAMVLKVRLMKEKGLLPF